MSLVDGLLLDPFPHDAQSPASFPRNYWIAQRSDGQYGSGTVSDPWDGSGDGFDARMLGIKNKLAAQQSGQSLKIES